MGGCGSRAVGTDSDPIITKNDPVGEETGAPAAPLSAARLEAVTSLFKEWDLKGDGMIPLGLLDKGGNIEVGNVNVGVLKQLKDMDFNGDGSVELSEWVTYWTTIGASLSDSDFEMILKELAESGENMMTIARCTLLAEQANEMTGGPADEDEPASPVPELAEDRKAKIQQLWEAFDYEGTGQVEIAKVTSASVSVGAQQISVCQNFSVMDADGDGCVSQQEMFTYFGYTSAKLSDEEFELVIGDMLLLAEAAKGVNANLKLAMIAQEGISTGEAEAEGEEGAAAPPLEPLSAPRAEKVEQLFKAFDPDMQPIDLDVIAKSSNVDIGPHKSSVLGGLKSMDYNGDGKVEYEEMKQYFTAISATVSDDDFTLIIDDLIDSATSAQMIKELVKSAAA